MAKVMNWGRISFDFCADKDDPIVRIERGFNILCEEGEGLEDGISDVLYQIGLELMKKEGNINKSLKDQMRLKKDMFKMENGHHGSTLG